MPYSVPVSADILSLGMTSAAGEDPFSLLCAIGGDIPAVRPWDGPSLPDCFSNLNYAPVAPFPPEAKCALRLETMLQQTLGRAVPPATEHDTPKRLLILLLPSAARLKAHGVTRKALSRRILNAHSGLTKADLIFSDSTPDALQKLTKSLEGMATGRWDEIIFGGADSLAAKDSLQLLSKTTSESKSEKDFIPGEGAAFVRLQVAGASNYPLARITLPLSECSITDQGPRTSLEHACNIAGVQLQDIDCFIPLDDGLITTGKQDHYPEAGKDKSMEVLHLTKALGRTGVAALPLALCAATSRFDFQHPPAENILMYHQSSESTVALCMQRPLLFDVLGQRVELNRQNRRQNSRRDLRHPR